VIARPLANLIALLPPLPPMPEFACSATLHSAVWEGSPIPETLIAEQPLTVTPLACLTPPLVPPFAFLEDFNAVEQHLNVLPTELVVLNVCTTPIVPMEKDAIQEISLAPSNVPLTPTVTPQELAEPFVLLEDVIRLSLLIAPTHNLFAQLLENVSNVETHLTVLKDFLADPTTCVDIVPLPLNVETPNTVLEPHVLTILASSTTPKLVEDRPQFAMQLAELVLNANLIPTVLEPTNFASTTSAFLAKLAPIAARIPTVTPDVHLTLVLTLTALPSTVLPLIKFVLRPRQFADVLSMPTVTKMMLAVELAIPTNVLSEPPTVLPFLPLLLTVTTVFARNVR